MKKTIAITATVMFAVILGIGAMTPALAAKNSYKICHYDEDENVYEVLSVGKSGAINHLAHDDLDQLIDPISNPNFPSETNVADCLAQTP